MHELSMIQEVMRVLEKSAAEHNIKQINSVKLVVGKLTAALPDALRFCFEALAKEPPFMQTRLEIEEIEVQARCNRCHQDFKVDDSWFYCALCGSPDIKIIAGDELYVDYYEGD